MRAEVRAITLPLRRPLATAFGPIAGAIVEASPVGRAGTRPRTRWKRPVSHSMKRKKTGVTSRVRKVELMTPPMMPTAIGPRNSEPEPFERAVGSMPSTMAALVIRIGRRRAGPASRTASVGVLPSRTATTAWSTRRMPFFVTRPMRSMMPIMMPIDIAHPVTKIAIIAPTIASGSAIMIVIGCTNDSNCDASTM